jgi:hypothetical protein
MIHDRASVVTTAILRVLESEHRTEHRRKAIEMLLRGEFYDAQLEVIEELRGWRGAYAKQFRETG